MKPIRIQVPATVANLGPGFDTLALSVRLHNQLIVRPHDAGLQLRIEGEGQDALPRDGGNLIVQAARFLAEAHGRQLPGLELHCKNSIPLATGLGSSAAAIVAGMLAANALLQTQLPPAALLELASQMEGHPDNVAAALLGGLVIVGAGQRPLLYRRLDPAVEQLVIVIPELNLPTQAMREALPKSVPLQDAAFNLGRVALTVEALRTGELPLLSEAMQDRLHQPYRQAHIPGYDEVVSAAREAGAAAVALAGAGPSLVAFVEHKHAAVGRAMVEAFGEAGVPARQLVLEVDRQGALVDVD